MLHSLLLYFSVLVIWWLCCPGECSVAGGPFKDPRNISCTRRLFCKIKSIFINAIYWIFFWCQLIFGISDQRENCGLQTCQKVSLKTNISIIAKVVPIFRGDSLSTSHVFTHSLTHKLALVRIKYFMYGLWFKIQQQYTWKSKQFFTQKYLAIFRGGRQTVIPLLIRGVTACG